MNNAQLELFDVATTRSELKAGTSNENNADI